MYIRILFVLFIKKISIFPNLAIGSYHRRRYMIKKNKIIMLFFWVVFVCMKPVRAEMIAGNTMIPQTNNASVDKTKNRGNIINEPKIPPLTSLYATNYQTFTTESEWSSFANTSNTTRYLDTFKTGSDNS